MMDGVRDATGAELESLVNRYHAGIPSSSSMGFAACSILARGAPRRTGRALEDSLLTGFMLVCSILHPSSYRRSFDRRTRRIRWNWCTTRACLAFHGGRSLVRSTACNKLLSSSMSSSQPGKAFTICPIAVMLVSHPPLHSLRRLFDHSVRRSRWSWCWIRGQLVLTSPPLVQRQSAAFVTELVQNPRTACG